MKFKEDAVLYVVYKALKEYGYGKIDRLQVVKILYLLDKTLKEITGEKLSDYTYILERLGPYDQNIVVDLTKLVKSGKLNTTESYYEYILGNIDEDDEKKIKEVEKVILQMGSEIITKIKEIFELGKNSSQLLDTVHALKEVKGKNRMEIILD